LNRTDFVHVQAVDEDTKTKSPAGNPVLSASVSKKVIEVTEPAMTSAMAKVKVSAGNGTQKIFEAKAKGYTGEQCSTCSSMRVKRNGSCTVCEDCGTTSGCS